IVAPPSSLQDRWVVYCGHSLNSVRSKAAAHQRQDRRGMADKPETGRDDTDLRLRSVSPTVPALQEWFVREVLPLESTLMQFLRRSGRSKSDIDDLVQDIYVRVCETAAREFPDPVKPFVFTVARNLLIDRLRREQVVPIETMEDLDALNVAMDAPGPDQNVIAREELRRVQAALPSAAPRPRSSDPAQGRRFVVARDRPAHGHRRPHRQPSSDRRHARPCRHALRRSARRQEKAVSENR